MRNKQQKSLPRLKSGGFTLIELLVVIAIIGILATIVMVSLNTARAKARDTQRVAAVRQIQLALQMYYDANSSYPATATVWTDLVPTYMGTKPVDPQGTDVEYKYCVSDTKGYHLGTPIALEATVEGAGVLASDADLTEATDGCDPGFDGATTAIYDVTQ